MHITPAPYPNPHPVIGGYYYRPHGITSPVATTTPTQGYAHLAPFFVGKSTTFDLILLEVVTAGAGSSLYLGIYDTVNGVPKNRLLTSGALDSSTTGEKSYAEEITLAPGMYWLAALTVGGSVPQWWGSGTAPNDIVGNGVPSGPNNYSHYVSTGLTDLPATLPNIGVGGSTQKPAINIRVKA